MPPPHTQKNNKTPILRNLVYQENVGKIRPSGHLSSSLGVTLSSIVAVLGMRTILPMRKNVSKGAWLSLIRRGKVRFGYIPLYKIATK